MSGLDWYQLSRFSDSALPIARKLEGHAGVLSLGLRFARLGVFYAAALFHIAEVNFDSRSLPG